MSHECNTSKSGRVDYGRWHAHDLTDITVDVTLVHHFCYFRWFRFEIMLKCWEENPDDRPTFAELRKTMKDFGKRHKVKGTARLFSVTLKRKSRIYY